MKNMVFLISCFFFLCCTLPDPGCDDHSCDEKCDAVLKKHVKSLGMALLLNCPYDSVCQSRISFGWVREYGFYSSTCYKEYEYLFVGDSIEDIVSMNSYENIAVHEDNHVRFSLFDETKTEKKYDIDLSEIIHSFSVRDDSVEVKIPHYIEELHLYKSHEWGSSYDIINVISDTLKYEKYTFCQNDMLFPYYYFSYNLNSQDSTVLDSIRIYGDIYWK